MLLRQRLLLLLTREAGGSIGRMQLTKWSFLVAHETQSRGGPSFYDFVPFRFGPFSFTLYHEIDALVRDGHLDAVSDREWRVTPAGLDAARAVPAPVAREARAVVDRVRGLDLGALIDSVYERHPWYTVNAENVERRRGERPVAQHAVYTCGYEGASIDAFLDQLAYSGIQRIIDVRANPVARRYGFHKGRMTQLAHELGIEYEHVPDLGIPSAVRRAATAADETAEMFADYAATVATTQPAAIARASALLDSAPSVLVCRELAPSCCHRSLLATILSRTTGLPVVHLEVERWRREPAAARS